MKNLIFTILAVFVAQASFACTASFTSSVSGATVTFTNASTPPASWTSAGLVTWYFGDGTTSHNYNPAHLYALAGTYTVSMRITWIDSPNSNQICTDSIAHTLTTTVNGPKQISGTVFLDTISNGNPANPAIKLWLIQYNATAQTLYAVDSVNVTGTSSNYTASYTFNNEPAGSYLVKAMLTNGPSSGTAAVPTYFLDSLYWHGAHTVTYSGFGISAYNDIHMQNGTVTSGPGFISGSVTSGANKGTKTTGLAVPNIVMFLENMAGKPLAYFVTDGNGSYHFSNIPAGTYKVYPEILGCATTPSIVTVGSTPLNNIDFMEHTISKTVNPINVGVVNVTASSTFNIYPNPTNGIVNISWSSKTQLQDAHAVVTDIAGSRVFESGLGMNATSGTLQLNLSSLNAGMYFININAGDVSYTNKIVLQH